MKSACKCLSQYSDKFERKTNVGQIGFWWGLNWQSVSPSMWASCILLPRVKMMSTILLVEDRRYQRNEVCYNTMRWRENAIHRVLGCDYKWSAVEASQIHRRQNKWSLVRTAMVVAYTIPLWDSSSHNRANLPHIHAGHICCRSYDLCSVWPWTILQY